jgi:hypothetical protein
VNLKRIVQSAGVLYIAMCHTIVIGIIVQYAYNIEKWGINAI